MPPARHLVALCTTAFLVAASSLPAAAKTFVIPHILETSGKITNTQNTFDTQFFMTYAAGLAGSSPGAGATVDLYLYDQQTGLPAQAAGGETVCAPCSYALGDGSTGQPPRKLVVTLDDEIVARGGFAGPVLSGFVVAIVNGDADNVALTSAISNAKSSAFDLSVFGFEPQPIAAPALVAGVGGRILVLPHFITTFSSGAYSFDTTIPIAYSGGIASVPGGGGAQADLYLFDQDGAPLLSGATDVCNPCTYAMGTGGSGDPAPRKRSIGVRERINNAGGFNGESVKLGFAVVVIGGTDPNAVNLTSLVTNTKTSAFDVSVFGFEPQPIAAAAVAVESDVLGDVTTLRARPNPSSGGSNLGFTLARASKVSLEIFDAQGRRVAELPLGRREAGDHSVRWDGLDASGHAVAAGTYFGRLRAGDGSRVTRLVMLSP